MATIQMYKKNVFQLYLIDLDDCFYCILENFKEFSDYLRIEIVIYCWVRGHFVKFIETTSK